MVYFQNLKAQVDTVAISGSDTIANTVLIQPFDLLDIRITTTEKALESLTQSQTSGSVVTNLYIKFWC
jgi:hypothetical protein